MSNDHLESVVVPRFTVYPVMPTTNLQDSQSDRAVLSRPSLVLVTWLLDSSLDNVTKVMTVVSVDLSHSSLSRLSGPGWRQPWPPVPSSALSEPPRGCGVSRPSDSS